MRELKITKVQETIYLYPVPVIKENKYLIQCDSIEEAKDLISSVESGLVAHPDQAGPTYRCLSLHSDQQTRILKLEKT
jgi:hypothetical protein